MMTQEEYVNEVLALRRQGKTITEIAEELEYHPATISQWLKAGGPPRARTVDPAVRVIDEVWVGRHGSGSWWKRHSSIGRTARIGPGVGAGRGVVFWGGVVWSGWQL